MKPELGVGGWGRWGQGEGEVKKWVNIQVGLEEERGRGVFVG